MKTFNKSILAASIIALTSTANAALVFTYGNAGGATYNTAVVNRTATADDGQVYTLRATTSADRKLARQPNGMGLGVGLPNGGNPWWIGEGEVLNFELLDSGDNAVNFTLTGFATSSSAKIGYDERITVSIAGTDYLTGGNNTNVAGSINLSDENAMGSNPNYPNNRGSQFGWGADGVDGADVANNFSITGEAGATTANYRINTVTLELAPAANPVPVPAAAWLFGSALMGLTLVRRRK